ncbi:MAG TPA: ABC transporter permease subunit [Vicinamibacterales bacterium]|mgnify:CR=1 FL=1|nr:ABC transporter permease subunit [Vicinamibacterales bacterium]
MSLGFWSASRRVFDLSLGEMLWSRRTIFMALVVGGPVLLAVIVRALDMFGLTALRVNGQAVGGTSVFGVLIWMLFLRFIVPVLAVFYGTALMADEVEDKTLTYLFTRPIPRGAVLVGKYLAYVTCTMLVVLPAVVLVYFLVVPFRAVPGSFTSLVTDLGLLGLGLAVYGAVFAFVGAYFKRPLVLGLVFVFGWEPTVMVLPGYLKQFTVAHYLQALVPHAMPSDGLTGLLQGFFKETPSLGASLFWLVAGTVVFLWLATRAVERREYVLEQ